MFEETQFPLIRQYVGYVNHVGTKETPDASWNCRGII